MRVPPPRAGSAATVAAVAEGDLADDGEAEPRAGGRARRERTVEAVEDERQVVGVYAGAVVAHGELAAGQPYLDRALGRAELGGVVEQVPDRDAQPVGVALGRRPRRAAR